MKTPTINLILRDLPSIIISIIVAKIGINAAAMATVTAPDKLCAKNAKIRYLEINKKNKNLFDLIRKNKKLMGITF